MENTMKTRIQQLAAAALAVALAFVALPAAAADAAPTGVVNLNNASAEQLQMLPGIGPAVAQRIVEHREKVGAFKQTEDLMLVRGIGEKSFEKLRPYVAIAGATTLTEKVRLPKATKSTEGSRG